VVGSTLQQLNDAVTMAMTRRIEKEAIYRAIDSLDENPEAIEAFLEVTDGPYPTELRDRLIRLREQRLEMTARYGERHPRLIAVNASIEQTIEALLPELLMAVVQVRTEYEVALAEEAELSYEFERQKTVAMTLDLDSVNYNVLEREAQTIRTLYESLLKQEKELSVIGTSRTNNIRLMERATVPAYPYSPNHATDRFTAVAVGLTFGLGFVLLLERFNHRIRTPVDLKTGLGVPFFGYVPAVSGRNTPILNDDSPHQVIEALRSIRTTLILAIDPAPRRSPVIAVTSTHPLEGKTTIACNLALTLAQGNSRVLLIDADMRRPAVHKALDRDNTVGLSQFLSGEASPSQVIRRTEEPNLYLVTAGAIPKNPPELLSSERMKRFVDQVADAPFDWVIIDTPPVLAVTDALLLTPLVSAVAFVVLADSTSSPHARQALDLLHGTKNGGPTIGAILNRVELHKASYAYKRYYGQRYETYYAEAA